MRSEFEAGQKEKVASTALGCIFSLLPPSL